MAGHDFKPGALACLILWLVTQVKAVLKRQLGPKPLPMPSHQSDLARSVDPQLPHINPQTRTGNIAT